MGRKNLSFLLVAALLVGAVSASFLLKYFQSDSIKAVQIIENAEPVEISLDEKKLSKIEQTYQLILTQFVEEVGEEQLVEGAIQGMLASLDDPYSVYMDKETTKQFNESLQSSFVGIGAEISTVDGKITIVAPFKDSPAEKAGLRPKDVIISIDDEKTDNLDLHEATMKIRGEKGSVVKLEINRANAKEPFTVQVVREEIPFETVYSKIFTENNKKIGYIEIASFAEQTASDFKDHLKKLEREKIAGLIIDLRGNPGGLLSSVQHISQQLITDKKPYVQTETREGEKSRFFTTLKKKKQYPVTALIDNGSASAAEILAAALHEVEQYELIGETTFGKGTVQHPVDMNDGSSIKLTSLKWLTSDGNWIHKSGVKPTIEVSQPAIYKMMPLQFTDELMKDMADERVKHVQQLLSAIGFESGRTDGYFSIQTEASVRAFQEANKLKATGIVDEATVMKINEVVTDILKDETNDRQLQTALKILTR